MKKIFIACSKHFYDYIPKIKQELELMGYETILPNFYDNYMKQEKIKECDAVLVLNFNKKKLSIPGNESIQNYIETTTFLEMHNAYLNNKKIFVYNYIPEDLFYNEIVKFGTKELNKNLFNMEDNYVKFGKNNLLNYFSKQELEQIDKIKDLYARAFVIASIVFKDKKDKAGKPYFEHLFRVSLKLDEEIEQVSALLHDIVEDTEVSFKDLLEIGFPIEILEIVSLVTKPDIDTSNMTKEEKLKLYNDEIDKIINSGNIHAIRLKRADMSDNYNKERLSELPQEKQEWFNEKYGKQLIKLNKVVERNKIL